MEKKKKFKVIGKGIIRQDALDKALGIAKYVDDLKFGPNLLYGKLVRSKYPHARIKSIDVEKAKKLKGVHAVVIGAEFPNYVGLYLQDRTLFATDKVRYVGEAVAGVVAETEEIAEEAVELVKVDYEELPAIFDPIEALAPDAPILHENLGKYPCASFIFPQPGTNLANHFKIRKGDSDKAFKKADFVLEEEYRLPQIQHNPIETHASVALYETNGKVTMWTTSQSPFAQRNLLAKALNISHGDLRVIVPYLGGGFGSKAGVSMEACVIPLAMKVPNNPVKLKLTRSEELYTSFVRQALIAKIKMGINKDGKITAIEEKLYFDAGCYAEYGVNITRAAGYSCSGPYEVENVKSDVYCCYTNHPIGGPMRGFGMPELHWALEQHIDAMCRAHGLDPVNIRLKNGVRENSVLVTGGLMHKNGFLECVRKVAKDIKLNEKSIAPKGKLRGKGIAAAWKAPAMPPNASSGAILKFNEDGTVDLIISGMDLGQGSGNAMAQIAAETLGISVEKIRSHSPDTSYSPYEWQTVASRLTWSMGNAVKNAAMDARNKITALMSEYWKVKESDIDIEDDFVFVKKNKKKRMPVCEIVIEGAKMPSGLLKGGPIMGTGMFIPPDVSPLDKETGQGPKAVVHFTTGVQGVEVEVDTETGEVTVLNVSAAYDVGQAINPLQIKGQFEGGILQGLSSALYEKLILDKGVPKNASFVDYKIATAADAPKHMSLHTVEVPQEDGPYGARGVGEHTMIPTAPAISNAIFDATGIRIRELPITAEKIRAALKEKNKK